MLWRASRLNFLPCEASSFWASLKLMEGTTVSTSKRRGLGLFSFMGYNTGYKAIRVSLKKRIGKILV